MSTYPSGTLRVSDADRDQAITAPIAILAVVVLASLLSGYHGGLIVLVPVLAVLTVVRRLACGGWRRGCRPDHAS